MNKYELGLTIFLTINFLLVLSLLKQLHEIRTVIVFTMDFDKLTKDLKEKLGGN